MNVVWMGGAIADLERLHDFVNAKAPVCRYSRVEAEPAGSKELASTC